MRHMNLVIFLMVFVSLCANVRAIPSPTSDIYVNDFANILNDETKNYIISQSDALEQNTTAQLVVVTVENLDEKPIEDYALTVFREWGIGNKEKGNGVLLLLSKGDRKVKIEVGYGLEGTINDGKAGRILDEMGIPYFKEEDWNSGVCGVYSNLLSEIYKEYGLEVPDEVTQVTKYRNANKNEIYLDIGISVFIILLFLIFTKKGGGTPFIGGRGPFIGGGGFGGNFGNGRGCGGGSSGGGGASRVF